MPTSNPSIYDRPWIYLPKIYEPEIPPDPCYIDKLPVEILTEIFLLASDSDTNMKRLYKPFWWEGLCKIYELPTPLCITTISKSWRRLSCGMPKLWSNFELRSRETFDLTWSMEWWMWYWVQVDDVEKCGMDGYQLGSLNFFLRHSGTRPLSLSVNLASDLNSLPKVLLKQCHRIRRLHISSKVPVPNTINSLMKAFEKRGGNALEELTVKVPMMSTESYPASVGYAKAFSLSRTPQLTELSLPNVIAVELDAPQTMRHLKTIEIAQAMSVNQCLVLLDLAPEVEILSLRLDNFQDEDFDDEEDLEGIIPEYPKLQMLHVRSQEPLDLGKLLSSVALPGLQSFSFAIDGEGNWSTQLKQPVIDTLRRCSLETFSPVLMAEITDAEVVEVLSCIPTLKRLKVRGRTFSNEIIRALTVDATTANHKNLCPELRELRWTTRIGFQTFDTRVLQDMMCSRWRMRMRTVFVFAFSGVDQLDLDGHEEFYTMLEHGAKAMVNSQRLMSPRNKQVKRKLDVTEDSVSKRMRI